MAMTVHLRKPEGGVVCGSKSYRYSSGTPAAAECSRCRKASGLGKFNALEAIASMVRVAPVGAAS